MTKREFLEHIYGRMGALDLGNQSKRPANADVPRAVKIKEIDVPLWVNEYHLNPDVSVAQKHIENYLAGDWRLMYLINHDYFGLISDGFAEGAPKSEARLVANRILSSSPAIAQYLMFGYESNPLYEPSVKSFHGKNTNNAIQRHKMVHENMDFESFSPLDLQKTPNAVTEVDYLNELLECAKKFDEKDHVFFIDDENMPMILSTDEFYGKYLFGKSNDNSLF